MRNLIISKIEKLKTKEGGFKREKWNEFMIGHLHISEVVFEGMPDEFILGVYTEMVRWDEYSNWTKTKIIQWLKDVDITYSDINEKGEFEGREQLQYLIKNLNNL